MRISRLALSSSQSHVSAGGSAVTEFMCTSGEIGTEFGPRMSESGRYASGVRSDAHKRIFVAAFFTFSLNLHLHSSSSVPPSSCLGRGLLETTLSVSTVITFFSSIRCEECCIFQPQLAPLSRLNASSSFARCCIADMNDLLSFHVRIHDLL